MFSERDLVRVEGKHVRLRGVFYCLASKIVSFDGVLFVTEERKTIKLQFFFVLFFIFPR